jgi:hypothetical protein
MLPAAVEFALKRRMANDSCTSSNLQGFAMAEFPRPGFSQIVYLNLGGRLTGLSRASGICACVAESPMSTNEKWRASV